MVYSAIISYVLINFAIGTYVNQSAILPDRAKIIGIFRVWQLIKSGDDSYKLRGEPMELAEGDDEWCNEGEIDAVDLSDSL